MSLISRVHGKSERMLTEGPSLLPRQRQYLGFIALSAGFSHTDFPAGFERILHFHLYLCPLRKAFRFSHTLIKFLKVFIQQRVICYPFGSQFSSERTKTLLSWTQANALLIMPVAEKIILAVTISARQNEEIQYVMKDAAWWFSISVRSFSGLTLNSYPRWLHDFICIKRSTYRFSSWSFFQRRQERGCILWVFRKH